MITYDPETCRLREWDVSRCRLNRRGAPQARWLNYVIRNLWFCVTLPGQMRSARINEMRLRAVRYGVHNSSRWKFSLLLRRNQVFLFFRVILHEIRFNLKTFSKTEHSMQLANWCSSCDKIKWTLLSANK